MMMLAGILTACSSDDNGGTTEASTIVMPVTLSIPVSDGPVTRVGDPGTYEKFKLPRYAYIYIATRNGDGDSVIVSSTPTLDESSWQKEHYDGPLRTADDSIFRYTGSITVTMPTGRAATGYVFVALSTVPLPGLPAGTNGYVVDPQAGSTIQNYKFSLTDDVRSELANIYSTPYNYRPDGTSYYGRLTELNTPTPSLNIILYHIAAKLDLQWNVSPSLQQSTAIDSMSLSLPDASESYIFRPLETAPTTTYSDNITITPGNQYYGRDYRYVVPMTGDNDSYTFGARIKLHDGSTRTSNINAGIINKREPFTPWIRGSIMVNEE